MGKHLIVVSVGRNRGAGRGLEVTNMNLFRGPWDTGAVPAVGYLPWVGPVGPVAQL